MRIRDVIADLFGATAVFCLLYAGLMFGHGMGW